MKYPCQSIVRLRERAGKFGVPVHAQVEVTHRCNLSCQHCYLDGHHNPEGNKELDLYEISGLFDQLLELQTMFLALTGGEFFMRNDAWEILDEASKRKFVITLLTNGTLLSRDDINKLKESNIYQIHVSILGDEKTHNAIAGDENAFQKTVQTMAWLKEAGITTVAKIIVTQKSSADYSALKEMALQYADDFVFAFDIIPTISNSPVKEGIQICSQDMCALPEDVALKMNENRRWPLDEYVCNAGRGLLAVDPYGEVFPCISFRMPLGNIRDKRLADIWGDESLESLRSLRRSDLRDCTECEIQNLCTFCPGRSWAESGDYSAKSKDLCDRALRMREWIDSVFAKKQTDK